MYYFLYPFLYLLSLLPWRIIYLLSDFFYLLVYYIIGYRKKVVAANLLIAFPDKTISERKKIEREFYHQLIDTFLEMIKMISITREEMEKRFRCNYELVNNLYESGQNVQIHGGHFFNWEYVNLAYGANLNYPFLGVYAPLSNKAFDRIILNMRSRFKSIMISTAEFRTKFRQYASERYALALAADQNPRTMHNAYWLSFMGKLTPFVTGPESGAKQKNTAIVFASFYPVKRGYYQSDLLLYTTKPNEIPPGKITLDYKSFIEREIRKRPANYLWSHRRWKWNFDPTIHQDALIQEAE